MGSEAPSASGVPALEEHADSDTPVLPQIPSPTAKRHYAKIRRHEVLRLLVRGRRRQVLDLQLFFVEWKRSLRRRKRHVFVLHNSAEHCAVLQQLPAALALNCDCG